MQAAADRLTAGRRHPAHHRRRRHQYHRGRSCRTLASNGYSLTVVGLPKTIDNDIIPVRQSLGAWTADEQASRFAQNIVGEHNSGSRMLLVHEVMGRHCGWLTAATAQAYQEWLDTRAWLPDIGLSREAWEVRRLRPRSGLRSRGRGPTPQREDGSDRLGQPFHLRGAGLETILAELSGPVMRSKRPFGHVKISRSTRVPGLPASSPSGWMPGRSWCRSRGTFPVCCSQPA